MTIVQKSIRGTWAAEDKIDLGNNQVLQISTYKVSSGALVTTATVSKRDGAFLSHRMFTDFRSQRMVNAAVRCSEKNVASQHAEVMGRLAEIKEAIAEHYAKELA